MRSESNSQSKMKFIIADDHALFLGGLSQLVKSNYQNVDVREANSLQGISELILQDPDIDLIVLDLMMPGVDGLGGLEKLRSEWPEIPVIVISAKEDIRTIRDSLSKGAMGFIPKSSAASVTAGAIQLVLSGGIYVPPALLEQHGADDVDKSKTSREISKFTDVGLTERQVQVLSLIKLGKSNNDIAERLGLTTGTVKVHISRIFKILGVGNRTEAAAKFGEIEKSFT